MKVTSLSCPSCGGQVEIKEGKKPNFCEYCGNALIINDAEDYGYQFEKGRQRAQEEERMRQSDDSSYEENPLPKKGNILLWVLGWIFMWPVPLTILILRGINIPKTLKYIIITFVFILYMLMGYTAGTSQNQSQNESGYNIEKAQYPPWNTPYPAVSERL